ncbi:uncharacterized protein PAC_02179 [Phialocephala subalpina]|uniref:Uncharacterized protein n=1 Tax=Phialocephala subalpina TaxID=576137 RepID=A0A1L7WHT1_9HELO|nr:uncharacterized protein PAC_02179 [Phialocephala subalpina]
MLTCESGQNRSDRRLSCLDADIPPIAAEIQREVKIDRTRPDNILILSLSSNASEVRELFVENLARIRNATELALNGTVYISAASYPSDVFPRKPLFDAIYQTEREIFYEPPLHRIITSLNAARLAYSFNSADGLVVELKWSSISQRFVHIISWLWSSTRGFSRCPFSRTSTTPSQHAWKDFATLSSTFMAHATAAATFEASGMCFVQEAIVEALPDLRDKMRFDIDPHWVTAAGAAQRASYGIDIMEILGEPIRIPYIQQQFGAFRYW